MRLAGSIFALVLFFAALFGCGGGPEGTSSTGSTSGSGGLLNPYTGSFSGTFIGPQGSIGTVSFSVDISGNITGTEVVTSTGASTSLTGTVTSGGVAAVTIGTDATTGTFSAVTNQTPTASVALTDASNDVTDMVLIVNPANITGGVQDEGDFAGSLFDFSNSTPGIIAMNVSTTGAISGSILLADTGTPTLENITGNMTSTFSGNPTVSWVITLNGTQIETASGTATLSGGGLSGTMTTSNGGVIDYSAQLITPATAPASKRASLLKIYSKP